MKEGIGIRMWNYTLARLDRLPITATSEHEGSLWGTGTGTISGTSQGRAGGDYSWELRVTAGERLVAHMGIMPCADHLPPGEGLKNVVK